MPALAMRMLMGPKWDLACEMHDWMESSEEISPVTAKRYEEVGMFVMGRISWAVTLHPCAKHSQWPDHQLL